MLRKLLKHELKNTYLEITIINGIIIFFTIISSILIQLEYESLLFIPIMSIFFLIFTGFVLLLINIIKSFNQKLFSKEGYLTLTIPVSIDKIIISKIIVNMIWWFLTLAVLFISLMILGLSAVGTTIDLKEAFGLIRIDAKDIIPGIFFIISAITSGVLWLVVLFFTLCVLNIGKIHRFKILLGVLIFYGMSMIMQAFESIYSKFTLGLFYESGGYVVKFVDISYDSYSLFFGSINGSLDGLLIFSFTGFIVEILFIVGIYMLGRMLITKKLELE